MERRHKIEIIIAVLILLGLFVLLLWYFLRPSVQEQEQEREQEQEQVQYDEEDLRPIDTSELPDQPETIVRVFVERFGSFSSESGYGNIEDVLVLATSEMQAQLNALAQDARAQDSDSYYGVSTSVIGIQEQSRSETSATYSVTTQRRESIDSPANTSVRYQEMEISLVADGDTWLVSDFAWQ